MHRSPFRHICETSAPEPASGGGNPLFAFGPVFNSPHAPYRFPLPKREGELA